MRKRVPCAQSAHHLVDALNSHQIVQAMSPTLSATIHAMFKTTLTGRTRVTHVLQQCDDGLLLLRLCIRCINAAPHKLVVVVLCIQLMQGALGLSKVRALKKLEDKHVDTVVELPDRAKAAVPALHSETATVSLAEGVCCCRMETPKQRQCADGKLNAVVVPATADAEGMCNQNEIKSSKRVNKLTLLCRAGRLQACWRALQSRMV